MKIPQTFVPEKDLENKIFDLTKGPKIFHNEEVYDVISQEEAEPYYILCMAEEVVKKLGNDFSSTDYYRFQDIENKIIIKRQFYPDVKLTIYLKKGLFKKKVLETKDDKTILLYNRGEWKKDLEKLYEIALQK